MRLRNLAAALILRWRNPHESRRGSRVPYLIISVDCRAAFEYRQLNLIYLDVLSQR